MVALWEMGSKHRPWDPDGRSNCPSTNVTETGTESGGGMEYLMSGAEEGRSAERREEQGVRLSSSEPVLS